MICLYSLTRTIFIIFIVGLFGANSGVKGSGKNDRSAASRSAPKPPQTTESSQAQAQRSSQTSSNVNFNTGSPSAAKFWSSFFQQQSAEDAAYRSWGSGDAYEYDDLEAEAEEYFRDTVDYRSYSSSSSSSSSSRSAGDRYATDGSLTSLLVISVAQYASDCPITSLITFTPLH